MKNEIGDKLKNHTHEFIILESVFLLFVLVLIGMFFHSYKFVLGSTLGACVAIINHHGLYRAVSMGMALSAKHGEERGLKAILFGFFIRLALSGVAIFLGLKGDWASPIAIIFGVSVVMVSSLIVSLAIRMIDRGV